MAFDLLQSVDWNEWKRASLDISRDSSTITYPNMPQPKRETERVALLVLRLGKHINSTANNKRANTAINKIVRMALREIEQAVLTAEQDIDYEKS